MITEADGGKDKQLIPRTVAMLLLDYIVLAQ